VIHLDDVGEELTPAGHQHFLRVREPRGLAWKTERRFDKGSARRPLNRRQPTLF
jgi:hypothetical protein